MSSPTSSPPLRAAQTGNDGDGGNYSSECDEKVMVTPQLNRHLDQDL